MSVVVGASLQTDINMTIRVHIVVVASSFARSSAARCTNRNMCILARQGMRVERMRAIADRGLGCLAFVVARTHRQRSGVILELPPCRALLAALGKL